MTTEKDNYNQETCLSWNNLCSYAFNQLDPKQRQLIDNHLSDCTLCRRAMEGVWQLLQERPFSKEALMHWFERQHLLSDQAWSNRETGELPTEA